MSLCIFPYHIMMFPLTLCIVLNFLPNHSQNPLLLGWPSFAVLHPCLLCQIWSQILTLLKSFEMLPFASLRWRLRSLSTDLNAMNEGEVGNEGTQEEESLSSLHPLNTSCELSLLWYVSSCATVFVTLAVLCLMEIVNSSQQTPPVSFLLSVVCPPMALCICSYSRSRYSLLTILPSLNNKNKIITKNKQTTIFSQYQTGNLWAVVRPAVESPASLGDGVCNDHSKGQDRSLWRNILFITFLSLPGWGV